MHVYVYNLFAPDVFETEASEALNRVELTLECMRCQICGSVLQAKLNGAQNASNTYKVFLSY